MILFQEDEASIESQVQVPGKAFAQTLFEICQKHKRGERICKVD
jgi:hypothetical protein